MKRLLMVGGTLAVLILIGTTVLGAQHQMGGHMQRGSQQEQPSGQPSMMGRGMMGMPMMCQVMPQMMGGHMELLGMMGGDQLDPKVMARMLQLRGDMLKAMGEVLLKHGKAMEEVQ
jgi:hypothetical protein